MFFRPFGRPQVFNREVERLRSEIERVFQGDTNSRLSAYPALNVYSTPERLVITAELPGLTVEDIDLSVVGSTLTIKGKRESQAANGTFLRRERYDGSFVRSLDLPYSVETSQVKAVLENGVLCISLPRAEADKPRKIQISGK